MATFNFGDLESDFVSKVPWDAEEVFTMSDRMMKVYKINDYGEKRFIAVMPDFVSNPMTENHLELFLQGKDLQFKTLQRLRK